MQLTSGYEERRGRIEIVPLMNVIFLLLVFFIYTMVTMTVHRGVRVTLPSAAGAVTEPRALVITLTAANALSIDGQPLTVDEAAAAAVAATQAGAGGVLISGDCAADLGTALELVARLRASGIGAVSFLVQPESGP